MFTVTPATEPPPVGYHNGSTKNPANNRDGRLKAAPISDRDVIAWDMEGMSLSGDDKPQHAVLFGCSHEPDKALLDQNLATVDMLDYIVDVGSRNRGALHVGYHFRYDSNMILKDLPVRGVRKLWRQNVVKFVAGEFCYIVQYFPGKKFTVTRGRTFKRVKNQHDPSRVTVTIYDYSSFFGGAAFLNACENILKTDLSARDRQTIKHGKAARGSNSWNDIDEVVHYWRREIELIARTFAKFRDVMCQAGFALREWYGPGALANYINSAHELKPHIAGAQHTKTGALPDEVHEASKVAFSGGRFEAFRVGYVPGPIYGIDINSAYPDALTAIPSLSPKHGKWTHIAKPSKIERFGVYRITFHAPNASAIEYRPMPLFYRDPRGLITYPAHVHGWYMSPEASIVQRMPGVTIHEGWYWDHDGTSYPWQFLHEMYERRQRLGKDNLLSIPFKLGPNSLYGKYAQTVGWNEKERTPPRWHALPIAAWVTSMCRAKLWNVIQQIPDKVIAVETDSVYTTVDPSTLNIPLGDALGQWGVDEYEAIIYLQSGMYLTQREGEWRGVRSRGVSRGEFQADSLVEHLRDLEPGSEWPPYTITTKPRFIGMGSALATKNFADNWRTWQPQRKGISIGDAGKRRHHHQFCGACERGIRPIDGAHPTFIASTSDGVEVSHPRALPWEGTEYSKEVQAMRDAKLLEGELIS